LRVKNNPVDFPIARAPQQRQYGLYASIVLWIFGCLWGNLAQLKTGPTPTAFWVVLSALSSIARPGLFRRSGFLLKDKGTAKFKAVYFKNQKRKVEV
jgi:hypothetical protein